MQYITGIIATLMLIAAGAATAADTGGPKLYKWTDNQGQVHYGDHVPDEYATQERHVFNKQGIEVDTIEAQKTPEQMAVEEQKKAAAEDSRKRDHNLLSTYASVQEIERLRDQRLGLVADQIKVSMQFLEILRGRLEKLRSDAMRFKPYSDNPTAPRLPDVMAEDLARVGGDIRTQEENLRRKRTEETDLRSQFGADIARYKELKGIN
ncbi:MAG: DUF4124 domain-containing protein [Steroidobacterales bacterium]